MHALIAMHVHQIPNKTLYGMCLCSYTMGVFVPQGYAEMAVKNENK